MTTVSLVLPRHFYDDHVARDLPSGTVFKTTSTKVLVVMTHDEVQDLLSDAEYYASFTGPDLAENRGLVYSARATLRYLRTTLQAEGIST